MTDKDTQKLDRAASAFLAIPSPKNKRRPNQQKGDSKRRWRMVFDRSGKPSIVEVKD